MFSMSLFVITGEKAFISPLIPLLMRPFVFLMYRAFFKSAKLLLIIPILLSELFKSVVIVLNGIL